MLAILHSLGVFVADLFKSQCRLEAENLFLRQQLNIALRQAPPRLRLRGSDRALLVWMTRLWPSLLGAAQVVQPETILRWHRAGFKAFWRWKSRKRARRPRIDHGLRDLIQRMSKENPQWGASRIHGELQMLGFEVAQSTVSKYMVRGHISLRKDTPRGRAVQRYGTIVATPVLSGLPSSLCADMIFGKDKGIATVRVSRLEGPPGARSIAYN